MTEGKPAAVHPLRIPGLASALAMQVHAMTDVHVSRRNRRDRHLESQETQFLLDTLRPGDVFVDVGANIGYFTLLASRLVGPGGAVLARLSRKPPTSPCSRPIASSTAVIMSAASRSRWARRTPAVRST